MFQWNQLTNYYFENKSPATLFKDAKLIKDGEKNMLEVHFEYDCRACTTKIALKEHKTFHNGSSYAKALIKVSSLLIAATSFD
jgi:hypothetical protein